VVFFSISTTNKQKQIPNNNTPLDLYFFQFLTNNNRMTSLVKQLGFLIFVFLVLHSTVTSSCGSEALSCRALGLPMTATEYFARLPTPIQGQSFNICVEQDGVAYYPVTLIVGVEGTTYREYIPVDPDTNWSFIPRLRYGCDGLSGNTPLKTRSHHEAS